jgi:hypothetical protein
MTARRSSSRRAVLASAVPTLIDTAHQLGRRAFANCGFGGDGSAELVRSRMVTDLTVAVRGSC